jgi:hypothetical protein
MENESPNFDTWIQDYGAFWMGLYTQLVKRYIGEDAVYASDIKMDFIGKTENLYPDLLTALKNAGEAALDSAGIANQYVGRGDIETAYNAAMADLSSAIGSLSEADKKKYFEEGKKFASVEVITPITQNTVPYGKDMLVLHGVVEHDEGGNAIGEDKQAGRDLGKLIADANADSAWLQPLRQP